MKDKIYIKPISQIINETQKEGPIPFIWGPIKRGSFGYIFGPSKSGKTIFCENLALSLISGKDRYFDMPIEKDNYKVLFISLEEYARPRSERNDIQIKALEPTEDQINNLIVVTDDFPKFINEEEEWIILEECILESEANVVIVDSLSRLIKGKREDADIARKLSSRFRTITFEHEITLVMVHHTPKHLDKPITIHDLGGSHVFAQEADFIIGINRTKEYQYYKTVASRYSREDNEEVILFDIGDNLWLNPIDYVPEDALFVEVDGRNNNANYNAITRFIQQKTNGVKGATFKVGTLEKDTSGIMNRDTLYRNMKKLSSEGIIEKKDKGEYSIIGDLPVNPTFHTNTTNE